MPVKSLACKRYLLAALAGVLLGISFPTTGIAGFAWIAPGLMLSTALGARGGESFRIGYVAGMAHYLVSLHWLLFIPATGFPILGWAALSAFLALFPAAWVWIGTGIPNLKVEAARTGTPSWATGAAQIASWSWGGRTLWALTCAATWVGLEMILARIFGGFPWNLLGTSQHLILPLIQIASLTGVYGVSFLVVWGSMSLLCAAIVILKRPHMTSAWMGEVLVPLTAVIGLFVFGIHRIAGMREGSRELSVALVQPSIPQTLIWNPEKDEERFQDLIRLSEAALTNHADLLIWPEAAVPRMLRYDLETYRAITNLAIQHHVWMIVGSDDAEVTPQATNYYNCSFLVSPRGRLVERYCKRSLVIFGEYIPLERWLPFVKWFTPVQGSFTAGDRVVEFDLSGLQVRTSVLICFEDTFPQLGRDSALPDTDFLVNITNDGWFGQSSAQFQHAATAGFRAVENGLPLVRCTNTGLTCWFDSVGRMRDYFSAPGGDIYGSGFLDITLPLLPPGQKRPLTFYNRHGDVFGWSCVAIGGGCLAGVGIRRPRREEPGSPAA